MNDADTNLLARWLSGGLSPREEQRLDELLDRSSEARRIVVHLFALRHDRRGLQDERRDPRRSST